MEKDVAVVNPRLEAIGQEMFVKPQYKAQKVKKVRAASAKPRSNLELQQVSEKEYLETVYPHIDLTLDDRHCNHPKDYNRPWFNGFMSKVHDTNNRRKYEVFIRRCMKTSPYNENSGYNYSILKKLAKERSKSGKRSYEKNTVSFVAKCI